MWQARRGIPKPLAIRRTIRGVVEMLRLKLVLVVGETELQMQPLMLDRRMVTASTLFRAVIVGVEVEDVVAMANTVDAAGVGAVSEEMESFVDADVVGLEATGVRVASSVAVEVADVDPEVVLKDRLAALRRSRGISPALPGPLGPEIAENDLLVQKAEMAERGRWRSIVYFNTACLQAF